MQIIIVSINLYEDEDGRIWRNTDEERWMADEMHAGNNIAGRQSFRIRVLVTEMIKRADASPEILVLGSSRSMLVGEELLGQGNVVNNSVSSSRLIHYFSVLGQYMGRGLKPLRVLIGVDPWIFKNEKIIIWPMEAGAINLASHLNINKAQLGFDDDFNWTSYFSGNKAYNIIFKSINNTSCNDLIAIHNENTPCAMRRFDGSLKYPYEMITRSKDDVTADVKQTARGRMHSYDGFNKLDPIRLDQLRQLLVYLKSEKIHVDIFLAPYHPLVETYQSGKRDWILTQEAEKSVRKIAKDLSISVMGSYSASIAGCDDSEFYDDIHPRESCLSRILHPIISNIRIESKQSY